MAKEPLRLANIRVEGLFDRFDHEIPLRLDDRITIIHGPNGYGKTTVLQMISTVFHGALGALTSKPFKRLSLRFADGTSLHITRLVASDPAGDEPRRRLQLRLMRGSRQLDPPYDYVAHPRSGRMQPEFPLSAIEDLIERLDRVSEDLWRDRITGDLLSLDAVFDRYGDRIPIFGRDMRPTPQPAWFQTLCDSLSVHLIETQRLTTAPFLARERRSAATRRDAVAPAVAAYSAQLAEIIQQNLARYANTSQALDRTFPNRILNATLPDDANRATIRRRYQAQGELRKRLTAAGLLDTAEEFFLPTRQWDDTEARVLWYYLEDIDAKLAVLNDLLMRIELLNDIINTNFRYKQMSIDKSRGFVFQTDKGETLLPTALSSGEQHELVLAYQLLFGVRSSSLILIDEPEISLHVVWQHRFLQDLSRVSGVANLDFLIATHSPQIIHRRRDLAVDLGNGGNA